MNQEIFLCTNVINVEAIDEMSNLENVIFKSSPELFEYMQNELQSSNYFDKDDEDNDLIYFDDNEDDTIINKDNLNELLNSANKIEIYTRDNSSNYDEYVLLFIIEKFSI